MPQEIRPHRTSVTLDTRVDGWLDWIAGRIGSEYPRKGDYITWAIDRDRRAWLKENAAKNPEAVRRYRAWLEATGAQDEMDWVEWPDLPEAPEVEG